MGKFAIALIILTSLVLHLRMYRHSAEYLFKYSNLVSTAIIVLVSILILWLIPNTEDLNIIPRGILIFFIVGAGFLSLKVLRYPR